MKRNLLTIIIGAVLILIFILLLFVFQVRKSEVVVVTRFGRPDRDKAEPGAYARWPWPIENVYKLDQRIQNFESAFSETLTADNNNLLTTIFVGWRITSATNFFPRFAGGSVPAAERMLRDIVSQANSAIVGKHPLGDFVNADEKALKFDAIEAEIRAVAEAQLVTNNCGIKIEYLGIKKLGLPESVTQAVFERMTSDRDKLAKSTQFEGEAEAQRIRSSADRAAAEMISGAEGEARKIRGRGEAVAAEVLPVFEANPALAIFLMEIEALEASTKEKTTLIFDTRTPPFNLFNSSVTNKLGK